MELLRSVGLTAAASAASIAVLFLLTKLMGSKQVAQMTMFDYITGITFGSVAAELATELEEPEKPLTALVVYGLAAAAVSVLTSKSVRLRARVTGKPLVLLEDGVIYRENLKRARMDLNEFLTFCRVSGYFDPAQVQTALLEHNGAVSFLPKEANRPAQPADLDRHPKQSRVPLPLVMDGRLLPDNLARAGKAETWLRRYLLRLGYRDEGEVLLALYDGDGGLTAYPMRPPRGGE